MKRESIGPFTKGMNTLANETALPKDQCRSAVNVDFDKDGNFTNRQGFSRIVAALSVHSLFPCSNPAYLFACQKNNIGYFNLSTMSFVTKAVMPEAFITSWEVHNEVVYASNPAYHCCFDEDFNTFPLAVSLPPPFDVAQSSSGGLRQGSYTVAWSVLNSLGEESPLSDEVQIDVPEGGGIAITGVSIIPGSYVRIYASQPNGEELYRVIEAPMIATSFLIGITEITEGGMQPPTRFMAELPFGHFIKSHNSRLMVAFDNYVGFSSQYRPHLWDPRHNFIMLESTITMLASITDGVFVSDNKAVVYLDGKDPEQFIVKDVDADPAIYGSAVVVPGAHLMEDLQEHDKVVVWLSKTGHMAGLPDGSVVRLNPGQLDLPGYTVASSTLAMKDGIKRVVIPVNSNRRIGTGTAVDTEIF